MAFRIFWRVRESSWRVGTTRVVFIWQLEEGVTRVLWFPDESLLLRDFEKWKKPKCSRLRREGNASYCLTWLTNFYLFRLNKKKLLFEAWCNVNLFTVW